MLLFVIGVFLFLGFEQTFALNGCPYKFTDVDDQYLRYRNGVCYRFYIEKYRHFWDAERVCELHGGTLVVIGDQQTNDYIVKELFTFMGMQRAWIGLIDANKTGTFEWIDGSNMTYTNWGYDQGPTNPYPKNAATCCVIRYRTVTQSHWEDRFCKNFERPFVCQYAGNTITTQTPQTTTQAPTTPRPTCPPFVCNKSCGMDGFVTDKKGCAVCECNL